MRKLVIIAGPTAVGKTASSILLAKKIGGEIISADSMQVYRGMDVGTAKIRKEEMEGVPHFLIDAFDPDEEVNIVIFQQLAKQAMEEIYARGHIPMIVGGTGFYIQSILYDIDFSQGDGENEALREHLEKEYDLFGADAMQEKLRLLDPISADTIHKNNKKRVVRALEYALTQNEPISAHNEREKQKKSPYDYNFFVLNMDRKILYDRIERRVDKMFDDGLVEEVRDLQYRGFHQNLVSMQGIGYKEVLEYLDGNCSLEEAIAQVKQSTRHFAKRQITWFKREKGAQWIDVTKFHSPQDLAEFMAGEVIK
jgi:tRNA dimethylallyltransferase